MIFEFIENGLPAGYKTNKSIYSNVSALQPIFDRMALPLPSKYRHLQYTREGGFNLFLNRYGMVLRFYPYNDEAQARHTDGINQNDHIYHAKALPYLGCVRYPNFTMQLMPAVKFCESAEHVYALGLRFQRDLNDVVDSTVISNVGYKTSSKEDAESCILLDTIYRTDNIGGYYERYLSKRQRGIMDNFEDYADLQQLFHDAWGESTMDDNGAMATFWDEAERICNAGERLHPSWLGVDPNCNIVFRNTLSAKGNFVRASKSYDRKLGAYLGEPSFLSSACSKALRVLGM
jgi:hypothetical protein